MDHDRSLVIHEIDTPTLTEEAPSEPVSHQITPPVRKTPRPSKSQPTHSRLPPRPNYPPSHSYTIPPSSGASMADPTRRAPSVSVRAYRNDLRGAIGDTSCASSNPFIRRLQQLRAWKKVLVEGAPLGTKDAVFFAPDLCLSGSVDSRGTPTSFVNIDPKESPHTVYRGDAFEISFLGMSVSSQDTFNAEGNELLLYSLTRNSDILAPGSESTSNSPTSGVAAPTIPSAPDGDVPVVAVQQVGTTLSYPAAGLMPPRALSTSGVTSFVSAHNGYPSHAQRTTSMNAVTTSIPNFAIPTGVLSATGDVPFIHYDPVIDGHDTGNASDTYVPVPATKALYLRCLGKKGTSTDDALPQSVSIRFTIVEIDKVSDVQARSISGVDKLGNYVSTGAESVPYLELLTRAFVVASSLGKNGLRRYEKPDHVHSVDMEFLLAERDNDQNDSANKEPDCGNYLQVRNARLPIFLFVNLKKSECRHCFPILDGVRKRTHVRLAVSNEKHSALYTYHIFHASVLFDILCIHLTF